MNDAESSSLPSSTGGATRKSSRRKGGVLRIPSSLNAAPVEGGAWGSPSNAEVVEVPVTYLLPDEPNSPVDSPDYSSTGGVSDEVDSEGVRVALKLGGSSSPISTARKRQIGRKLSSRNFAAVNLTAENSIERASFF